MAIQILSPDVIDQIAAGEVVERPAHLVKELVENSLDAGASLIEIDIQQGGRYVSVTDNGSGIAEEELLLALARHATSKIKLSSDIWRIHSFGFRGEALASIAAVSRMQLTSRTSQQAAAFQIRSEFGQIKGPEAVGGGQGTRVLIEDLFANVPARLKFLKSPQSEITQIKQILRALALAHYQTTFKVKINGELWAYWESQQQVKARVEQVLEQSAMIEGQSQVDPIKAQAIFCSPHQVSKNSKNIWLFVQGRFVQDRGLQAAVMEAYRQLLMHGEFPIACVFVQADPETVDVNIHPSKSQVKFLDPSLAFRAVLHSIRDKIEQAPWKSAVVAAPKREINLEFSANTFSQTYLEKKLQPQRLSEQLRTYNQSQADAPVTQQMKAEAQTTEANELDVFLDGPQSKPQELSQARWSHLDVLAQAHLTYIVAQSDQSVVFLDQHAAHERILYEKLMQSRMQRAQDVQTFLLPLSLEFEVESADALMQSAGELQKLGIELERLGPRAVGVISAPSILKDQALEKALRNWVEELMAHGGSYALEKSIAEICSTLACHSAVRAGQALSIDEMRELLRQMDEFPLSSFCPHGRPVYVEYSLKLIEKDFGRRL